MPQGIRRHRRLTALFALTVAVVMVLATSQTAEGAPPVDELSWTESCSGVLPMATLTARGNGRWATVVVDVSTDGGSTWEPYGTNPKRFEHDMPMTIGYSQAPSVRFRASDARNNGTLLGEMAYTDPISCS